MHFVKASVRLGTKGFFARASARNWIVIGGEGRRDRTPRKKGHWYPGQGRRRLKEIIDFTRKEVSRGQQN